MKLETIRTEEEYKALLEEANLLLDAEVATVEGDRLEFIAILLEKYEEEHYPIAPSHPSKAIKFRMEQMGLTQKGSK